MTTDIEQLKVEMMALLEQRPDVAATIGDNSRHIAQAMYIEEAKELSKGTAIDNFAVFFCIGAAWAITHIHELNIYNNAIPNS